LLERDFRKGLLANLDARRCVLIFREQYRFVVDPSFIYLTDLLVLVQVVLVLYLRLRLFPGLMNPVFLLFGP
jgi:hypothetical protein